MEAVLKTYDAKLDSKKRITIRNPKYDYYHVVEKENGVVVLEPRTLVDPFTISKKTLKEMEEDAKNLKSGIVSEPVYLTGIYQNVAFKQGYGPLEGMKLPTSVNLVFRCRYVSGTETISDESREVGWFTPDEVLKMITQAYLKKEFEDAVEEKGKMHFDTFKKSHQSTEFLSDRIL